MKTIYQKTVQIETGQKVGTGWLPTRPDLRDYTEENKEIKPLLKMLKVPQQIHQRSFAYKKFLGKGVG